ncbi:hypothetical protein AHU16_21655 [Salmonella enterica subsp. enterica serovar Give]|nr:hypothetical protein [Salmonella enterica subsp. enterica serovar Give]MII49958.1 hypothetical protein [Salmonella enterica subsp. enterica serovar Bredeney]
MGSDIFIGWLVSTESFEFIFRFEGEKLLICKFNTHVSNLNGLMGFKILLDKIIDSVREVNCICALKSNSGSPGEMLKRERLFDFFLEFGAKLIIDDDGDEVYVKKIERMHESN